MAQKKLITYISTYLHDGQKNKKKIPKLLYFEGTNEELWFIDKKWGILENDL